jgi:RsbT co-antagonist protein rsbRD N-terminal domain
MSLSTIASALRIQIPEIVTTWTNTVRADVRIKSSDDLSHGGLVDHVPLMLDEICDSLGNGDLNRVNITEARVHAYTRFRQGYRARDLISETAILRLILHDRIAGMLEKSSGQSAIEVLDSTRHVNIYLDEELRYAMAIFTESTPIDTPDPAVQ